jgi:hypothetical protein
MRVLYVDAINAQTAQSNIQGIIGAYKALGHEIKTFDYRALALKLGKDGTWEKGQKAWSASTSKALQEMNTRLVRTAKQFKPDFVHLGKCEFISGTAIAQIRRLTSAFIVHLYLDMSEEVKPWVADIGKQADWTMLAHQDEAIVQKHLKAGCKRVGFWIPGVDVSTYYPRVEYGKQSIDLLFTGNYIERTSKARMQLLNALAETGWQVVVYGRNWPSSLNPMIELHDFVEKDALARVISSARIALSYNTSEFRMYASWRRLLNTMACQTMLLCRYFPGLETVFEHELVWFKTIPEVIEKTRYYLTHLEDRYMVANRGMERVRRDFTWASRVQALLELL